MEQITPVVQPEALQNQISTKHEEKFTPKGAIAFFVALVILGLIIWFGIYFLMLDRT